MKVDIKIFRNQGFDTEVKALDGLPTIHSYIKTFGTSQAYTKACDALKQAHTFRLYVDGVNLSGNRSKCHSEENRKFMEMQLKAYHKQEARNPKVTVKTSAILDVKHFYDETDKDATLKPVESIKADRLLQGINKSKSQLVCTIRHNKVSIKELQRKVETFKIRVQSRSISINSDNKQISAHGCPAASCNRRSTVIVSRGNKAIAMLTEEAHPARFCPPSRAQL